MEVFEDFQTEYVKSRSSQDSRKSTSIVMTAVRMQVRDHVWCFHSDLIIYRKFELR